MRSGSGIHSDIRSPSRIAGHKSRERQDLNKNKEKRDSYVQRQFNAKKYEAIKQVMMSNNPNDMSTLYRPQLTQSPNKQFRQWLQKYLFPCLWSKYFSISLIQFFNDHQTPRMCSESQWEEKKKKVMETFIQLKLALGTNVQVKKALQFLSMFLKYKSLEREHRLKLQNAQKMLGRLDGHLFQFNKKLLLNEKIGKVVYIVEKCLRISQQIDRYGDKQKKQEKKDILPEDSMLLNLELFQKYYECLKKMKSIIDQYRRRNQNMKKLTDSEILAAILEKEIRNEGHFEVAEQLINKLLENVRAGKKCETFKSANHPLKGTRMADYYDQLCGKFDHPYLSQRRCQEQKELSFIEQRREEEVEFQIFQGRSSNISTLQAQIDNSLENSSNRNRSSIAVQKQTEIQQKRFSIKLFDSKKNKGQFSMIQKGLKSPVGRWQKSLLCSSIISLGFDRLNVFTDSEIMSGVSFDLKIRQSALTLFENGSKKIDQTFLLYKLRDELKQQFRLKQEHQLNALLILDTNIGVISFFKERLLLIVKKPISKIYSVVYSRKSKLKCSQKRVILDGIVVVDLRSRQIELDFKDLNWTDSEGNDAVFQVQQVTIAELKRCQIFYIFEKEKINEKERKNRFEFLK